MQQSATVASVSDTLKLISNPKHSNTNPMRFVLLCLQNTVRRGLICLVLLYTKRNSTTCILHKVRQIPFEIFSDAKDQLTSGCRLISTPDNK